MKKLALFLVLVTFAFAGTAIAADNAINFDNSQTFYASPVSNGTSTYILSTAPYSLALPQTTGATLWQINPATGTSAVWNGAYNSTRRASAYGTPVIYQAPNDSGVTVVFQVKEMPTNTGTSLWAVYFNSTGTAVTQWSLDLGWPHTGVINRDAPDYTSGGTGYAAHLLLDTDNLGTTVYGTSGVSVVSGASIWSVALGNQTGSVRLSNNQWHGTANTSVSTFWSAPLITGNSLFIVGQYEHGTRSGATLMMFDKGRLFNGPTNTREVYAINGVNDTSLAGSTVFATPAIAGNSLFVLDGAGGLTAFSINPNNLLGWSATDVRTLAPRVVTSVSASPVTDGRYLVVAANYPAINKTGVSCFTILNNQINGATGVSWWFEIAGATITATPAITDGYVYVPVNKNGSAEIYRFKTNQGNVGAAAVLDKTYTVDKNGQPLGLIEYASPIVVGGKLIFVSNNNLKKRLYSLDIDSNAYNYWRQFKFDAARTGSNSTTHAPGAEAGDDSGCFISTIK